MKQIIIIFLIIYYALCLIYLGFFMFSDKRRLYILRFIFAALLPFAGGIILLTSKFNVKNRSKDVDFYAEFKASDYKLNLPDRQRDLNSASVTDVLLFNDPVIKRKVVLDIFRNDSAQYVKELKMALNDPDTEVSHYASSALTEIKRKYDNAVIYLHKEMENNPDSLKIKIKYQNTVYSYIKCDIMDPTNKAKYMSSFCEIMSEFFRDELDDHNGIGMELYEAWLSYLRLLGKTEEALNLCNNLIQRFNNETIYFAVLELYYKLNEKDKFFETIEKIKTSNIRLSKEKLVSLRFFIGADERGDITFE